MHKDNYLYFLKNCTKLSSSSYANYTDFGRINETVARLKGLDSFDIYCISKVSDLDDITQQLFVDKSFADYNGKGKNQYSNALVYYRCYLAALQLASGSASTPIDRAQVQSSIPPHQESYQVIYFGAPGSGKSHRISKELSGVMEDNIFRTTFHPDSDYASFVGCYKPVVEGNEIKYEFTPQVFTGAYIQAWKNKQANESVYLVIEEINRGNCAQIFGDLFQLLDRQNDGSSTYGIKGDKDLAHYLEKELGQDHEGIKGGVLCLPSNLYIMATMNTSDQSLFPMDSAFKRRWDWEYVPIDYSEDVDSGRFIITIGKGKSRSEYLWVTFLEEVNKRILEVTHSEDKQMGNFFIKGSINEDKFKSKVLFYLWNEVCKDEYGTQGNFFRDKDEKEFSFNDLYGGEGTRKLNGLMAYLAVSPYQSSASGNGGSTKPAEEPQDSRAEMGTVNAIEGTEDTTGAAEQSQDSSKEMKGEEGESTTETVEEGEE